MPVQYDAIDHQKVRRGLRRCIGFGGIDGSQSLLIRSQDFELQLNYVHVPIPALRFEEIHAVSGPAFRFLQRKGHAVRFIEFLHTLVHPKHPARGTLDGTLVVHNQAIEVSCRNV